MLTRLLGCAVSECEDGVEALELLAQEHFDLALVDLQLPRLSGIEVVEAIRGSAATRHLRLVIVSQERREEVVRDLVALGVAAYLVKPLREEAVVKRILPLVANIGSRPAAKTFDVTSLRLTPDSPALLVDGDSNFRHFFVSVAERYGPIVEAESGANALALFRQTPVRVVFVGEKLGLLGADALIRKIRAAHDHPTRIVGIVDGNADAPLAESSFDATIPRVYLPATMSRELRPFVLVPGPLSALETVAPHFGDCLTSAVTLVFGMMTNLEVVVSDDHDGGADSAASSTVHMDINGRHQLLIELRVPLPLIKDLAARMLMSDIDSVTDEHCMSTASELANMVTGRLDTWFKEHSLPSRCALPETRVVPAGEPATAPPEQEGFTSRFCFPESGASFTLAVRARDVLIAT